MPSKHFLSPFSRYLWNTPGLSCGTTRSRIEAQHTYGLRQEMRHIECFGRKTLSLIHTNTSTHGCMNAIRSVSIPKIFLQQRAGGSLADPNARKPWILSVSARVSSSRPFGTRSLALSLSLFSRAFWICRASLHVLQGLLPSNSESTRRRLAGLASEPRQSRRNLRAASTIQTRSMQHSPLVLACTHDAQSSRATSPWAIYPRGCPNERPREQNETVCPLVFYRLPPPPFSGSFS